MNLTDKSCVCGGLGWLLVDIDGDDSRAWVQRCDECQYFSEDDPRNLYDEDVAPIAAEQTGTTVGMARPYGHDHEHPYLVGYPVDVLKPVAVATFADGTEDHPW